MEKRTQEQMVLDHLQTFGYITSIEAIYNYGITRLSARIFNLRKDGHKIKTDYVTSKNKYGEAVTFAKYILEDAKDE